MTAAEDCGVGGRRDIGWRQRRIGVAEDGGEGRQWQRVAAMEEDGCGGLPWWRTAVVDHGRN